MLHSLLNNIARPYYTTYPVGLSNYLSYNHPVYSSLPLDDFYLPSQSAQQDDKINQEEDESGLELFRSESEPRFFGLKKAALSGLISTLRGPPGNQTFHS